VGCLVGHLFMFLVGGKTPDQSVHLNLTTTEIILAVKEVLATNSVGLARELVGGVPQDHPFHPFLLAIAKQLDPR
ncbi:hypothetical protein, partial [Klebsiella pneumoniae]